eukprot:6186852-Pleurochrysis_carterae.AAC.1
MLVRAIEARRLGSVRKADLRVRVKCSFGRVESRRAPDMGNHKCMLRQCAGLQGLASPTLGIGRADHRLFERRQRRPATSPQWARLCAAGESTEPEIFPNLFATKIA